jgi:hypothetical protein
MILRFHPDEKEKLFNPQDDTEGADPVLYHNSVDGGYKVSVYTFYYKRNLAIGLGHSLFPLAKLLGYHDVDIEFVAVYSKPGDKRVYFSAHSQEGKWYTWDECEKENGELVVYVALNSHACYPHAKRYWRLCGLANDVTSKDGYEVKKPTFVYNRDYRKSLPVLIN